jgi:hypothetical protein
MTIKVQRGMFMSIIQRQLEENLKTAKGKHIFYSFRDQKKYLQNALEFINFGIENGRHVLFIENERNQKYIMNELKKQLSAKQLDHVHFICNFDFYCSNGDFHPPTVFHYYSKYIHPFLEKSETIWTWGLVEWRDDYEIIKKIEEYEKQVDCSVKEKGIISVCAYDANRMTKRLRDLLMQCHNIMMTDEELIYLPNKLNGEIK